MPKVTLDPGHQKGADSGASGNNLHEEDITLAICLQLKPLLQYNGIEVILTREGDYVNGPHSTLDESLQTRVAIANNFGADLFVSVHVNAFDGSASGEEVLIAGAGGRAEQAANKVYAQINRVTGWANRGIKTQNVYVLKRTNVPAILTENGFIDSASDSAKLKDPAFIHALAVAHAKGICEYFSIPYREQTQNTVVAPVVASTVDKDIYLSVRCYQSKSVQAIKDINKLGFAAKVMDLA